MTYQGRGGLTPAASFDWYQASIHEPENNIIEAVSDHFSASFAPSRGIAQYDNAIAFYVPIFDDPICELSWGGNQGASPHIKATGQFAPEVARLVKEAWPKHSVARADSCYDFVGAGLYDKLRPLLNACHVNFGVWRNEMGFPENGRTFYLGSPKSPVRLRCYEKDKERQAKGFDFTPGHLRLELQVRPRTREKPHYAALTAAEIWGATRWSRHVVKSVLALNPEPIKRVPQVNSTAERKLAWVLTQYARTLHEVGRERSHELLDTFYAKGAEGLSRDVSAAESLN